METAPAFRETRREPTDRRSWRQTPTFVGDVAAHVDNPTRLMVVTGVLPRGRVEVVTVDRAEQAVGDVRSYDDVNQALADGRIQPRSLPRRELSPVTAGIVDAAVESREGSA